uniref:Cms1 ribosomal small subunit homolog n=1 Tax=Canis lupus familiaris TaxID=9615 RepID=A0A8C0RA10_CANLF
NLTVLEPRSWTSQPTGPSKINVCCNSLLCGLIKISVSTKEDVTKTRRRRKKKITDVLAKSEPKPGTPEDLQNLMKDYFSSSRSVIELEELNLPDSCFLKANDLTHSLSSYLREICPKWVKLRKNHNEKKSVLMLIICSSAVRALELIRSMTAFRGDSKVMKLFAKHIKVQEQVKLLGKRVVHLGVGTPGRIKELIKQGGLNLNPLKFLVFDWNWRDQKLRRMMDIPEIRKEVFELLEMGVLKSVQIRIFEAGPFLSLGSNENFSFMLGFSSHLIALEYCKDSVNISYCFIMLTAPPDESLEIFGGDSLTKIKLSFANFSV